jgi:hypothetical protein
MDRRRPARGHATFDGRLPVAAAENELGISSMREAGSDVTIPRDESGYGEVYPSGTVIRVEGTPTDTLDDLRALTLTLTLTPTVKLIRSQLKVLQSQLQSANLMNGDVRTQFASLAADLAVAAGAPAPAAVPTAARSLPWFRRCWQGQLQCATR